MIEGSGQTELFRPLPMLHTPSCLIRPEPHRQYGLDVVFFHTLIHTLNNNTVLLLVASVGSPSEPSSVSRCETVLKHDGLD